MRFSPRWSAPAVIVSAAFLLSACAGGTAPSLPAASSSGTAPFDGARAEGVTAFGARTDTTCPKKFTAGCFTFSLSKGLKITWCYGPSSDPCKTTQDYKWSGDVCLAGARKCSPIPQMTATWTGPFKCTKKACQSPGKYELDTITKGKKPPKPTTKYLYKQQVNVCKGSCAKYYIGINVSK